MKLLIESWRKFVNEAKEKEPEVVTFDFDDTIRMTEDGRANPIVITRMKELKAKGVTVYVVTSRKDTKDNRLFITDFLDDHNVPRDDLFLTDLADKWSKLRDLKSDMHFDDDDEEFKAIQYHIDDFPEDKKDIKLMKIDWKTGKFDEFSS
tara:strand:+ start:2006 stop:2455 length:450 start_codon:yes stop_codon:yes gene_type:complete